jgi:hypothetical protein
MTFSGRKPDRLEDEATVYRALLRKQWIDATAGSVELDAFYLRKNKNEIGLSVNLASVYTPEQCAARFQTCYGVASLVVGQVRQLGLDVVADSPSHANILGLPYREDNRELADRLAELLAQQAILSWQPKLI